MKISLAANVEIDKIRRARSVTEINGITRSISSYVARCSVELKALRKNSSRLKRVSYSADDDPAVIRIDHGGVGDRPVRPTGTTKVNVVKKNAPAFNTVLKSFVPPKPEAVDKHSGIIDKLHEKSQEIDAIEATLLHSFAGVKGQREALTAVRALKTGLNETLNKSFESLGKISNTSLPPEVKSLGDFLVSYLIDNLDKRAYKDISERSYVVLDPNEVWHYTVYVKVEGLKNESGYVFDDYNVVLTALINKQKKAAYYLTTLSEFKTPGKFPLGKAVENATDIQTSLGIMLRHNDVISLMSKLPFPLDTKGVQRKGLHQIPGIKNVIVKDDALLMAFTDADPDTATVNKVLGKVLPLLNALIGNRGKRSMFTHKLVKTRGGMMLKIILIPTSKGGSTLNVDKLSQLQHALDLSDDNVKLLREALKDVAL